MVADDIREVADAVLAAYDSGALLAGLQDGPDGFKVRALDFRFLGFYRV